MKGPDQTLFEWLALSVINPEILETAEQPVVFPYPIGQNSSIRFFWGLEINWREVAFAIFKTAHLLYIVCMALCLCQCYGVLQPSCAPSTGIDVLNIWSDTFQKSVGKPGIVSDVQNSTEEEAWNLYPLQVHWGSCVLCLFRNLKMVLQVSFKCLEFRPWSRAQRKHSEAVRLLF